MPVPPIEPDKMYSFFTGGMLGPLPAYDFCLDLIIVEASGSVSSAALVNFDTSTSKPSRPEQFQLSGDFMNEGMCTCVMYLLLTCFMYLW